MRGLGAFGVVTLFCVGAALGIDSDSYAPVAIGLLAAAIPAFVAAGVTLRRSQPAPTVRLLDLDAPCILDALAELDRSVPDPFAGLDTSTARAAERDRRDRQMKASRTFEVAGLGLLGAMVAVCVLAGGAKLAESNEQAEQEQRDRYRAAVSVVQDSLRDAGQTGGR